MKMYNINKRSKQAMDTTSVTAKGQNLSDRSSHTNQLIKSDPERIKEG